MLEIMQQYYSDFTQLASQNQVVAGAVSLWGLTVLTFMLKTVPFQIWNFFKTQLTTSLVIDNSSEGKEIIIKSLMALHNKNSLATLSRVLEIEGADYEGKHSEVGMGNSTHWFFYKRSLFWVTKSYLESSGSEKQKKVFKLSCLGRSHEKLKSLVSDIVPDENNPDDVISVKKWMYEDWYTIKDIPRRSLKSVAASKEVKEGIVNKIDSWQSNESWYKDLGTPYKLSLMLHGKPGTGKTSLIKAIASHYSKNIHVVSADLSSGSKLQQTLANVPKGGLVVFEDIDCSTSVSKREEEDSKVTSASDAMAQDVKSSALGDVLNAIDGIVQLNDIMMIFTTNHLDKIDPAMLRKGRMDYTVEIDYLTEGDVGDYLKDMSIEGVAVPNGLVIPGCELSSIMLDCGRDSDKVSMMLKDFRERGL